MTTTHEPDCAIAINGRHECSCGRGITDSQTEPPRVMCPWAFVALFCAVALAAGWIARVAWRVLLPCLAVILLSGCTSARMERHAVDAIESVRGQELVGRIAVEAVRVNSDAALGAQVRSAWQDRLVGAGVTGALAAVGAWTWNATKRKGTWK